MKVLLIQPPVEDYYDTPIRTYPLGLCYCAAAVKDLAEVSILDCRNHGGNPMTVPSPFAGLEKYYRADLRGPFSLFTHYSRFGLSEEQIAAEICREKPDVVGVSANFSAFARESLQVATIAKSVDPAIITILGGLHPTLFPEEVLSNHLVDYVVRGEGETPLRELVKRLISAQPNLTDVPGLCFRAGNGNHISPPSIEDNLGLMPDRGSLDQARYLMFRKPYSFFLTSRGCPRHCRFCGKPPYRFRRRTLAGIDRELDDCASRGIRILDIEDDMFNADRGILLDVLDLFKKYPFELFAMNGLYPVNFDATVLDAMESAGFRKLNISLVDLNADVLDSQRRTVSPAFIKDLELLGERSVLVELHFIVGLPGQKTEELVAAIIELMGLRSLLGPSIYYPVPRAGSLSPRDFPEFPLCRSSVMFPENFPRSVTATILKLVRFVNFCKQLLDRNGVDLSLSDVLESPAMFPDERSHECFKLLVNKRRFFALNRSSHVFEEEEADPDLIDYFFKKIRGTIVRGFHSGHKMLMMAS
jgi:anaerobic magnesium-protoporphyrin IX monomethyl ester cyclase